MAGGKYSARNVTLQERRSKAVELRKSGASFRKIAAALSKEYGEKYSHVSAFEDVEACLQESNRKTQLDVEEYRQLELDRLDDWLLNLQAGIRMGDTKSIDTAVRISDRRCKLLGLDAPTLLRIEEGIEFELRQFLEQIGSVLDSETFRKVLEAYSAIQARAGEAERN